MGDASDGPAILPPLPGPQAAGDRATSGAGNAERDPYGQRMPLILAATFCADVSLPRNADLRDQPLGGLNRRAIVVWHHAEGHVRRAWRLVTVGGG